MVILEKMSNRRCIICCKVCNGNQANSNKQRGAENCIRNQLPIVFLLRKFINIPQEMCLKYLQEYGNPSLWIYWCDSCSSLIDEAQSVFRQLDLLQQRADSLRVTLKNAVISSEKDYIPSSLQRKRNDHQSGFDNGPTEAIRSYILFQGDCIFQEPQPPGYCSTDENIDEDVIIGTEETEDNLDEQPFGDSNDMFLDEHDVVDQKFDINSIHDTDRHPQSSQGGSYLNINKSGASQTEIIVGIVDDRNDSPGEEDNDPSVDWIPNEKKSIRHSNTRRIRRRRSQMGGNEFKSENDKEAPIISISPVDETKTKSDDPYRCNFCNKIISNKHNAIKHFRKVHQGLKERKVQTVFKTVNQARKIRKIFNSKETAKCNLCQRVVSRRHLKRHRKLVHKDVSAPLTMKKKDFPTPINNKQDYSVPVDND